MTSTIRAAARPPIRSTSIETGTARRLSKFATQLRARGHKAYVIEAHVPGRGTWHRVRIGPFSTQHAASTYRSGFEGREHVVPFIVPPQK